MSGTVGITPVRPGSVIRALVGGTRSALGAARSRVGRIRRDGGLRGWAALPAAIAITAVLSWLVISVAGSVRVT
ncbi:MAG TPA: hypothetical protein VFX15_10840 [Actinomycetes bacterium]|nr:hypothetical protein [Actinomycetes bacterium]